MKPRWSRRDLLAAGGALTALAPISFATSIELPSLRELAHEKGFVFGSALSTRGLADPPYRQLITEQCGIVVAETEFKMPALEPVPGEFKFERADALLAFAEGAGLKMRGHNFLWHHPRWLPRWLETYDFGADAPRGAEALLTHHIRTVAAHFGRRVTSWDVVNEAVDNVTGEMRETRLSRALGSADAVIELAFRTARDAMRLAAQKLPIKTKFVTRADQEGGAI